MFELSRFVVVVAIAAVLIFLVFNRIEKFFNIRFRLDITYSK